MTLVTTRFRELVSHFFRGFFDVEIIHPTAESRLTVGHILALMVTPSMLLSVGLLGKYTLLEIQSPHLWEPTMWKDKIFALAFSTSVLGFVTVFQWDTLFFGKRDYVALAILPIRAREILAAKLVALAMLLCLFLATINVGQWIFFPAAATRLTDTGAQSTMFAFSFVASSIGISIWVFSFLIGLQGLLMNLLPAKLFRAVSPLVQVALLMVMLFQLFLTPLVQRLIEPAEAVQHTSVYLLPTMWFLGWSEWMRGARQPAFAELAALAGWAFWGTLAFAGAVYLLSYYRHLRKSLETSPDASGEVSRWERLLWRLAALMARHPVERSVLIFTMMTALRSRRHRLIWSAYTGVGLALVINAALAQISQRGYEAFAEPAAWSVGLELALIFIALAGLRFVFTIPAELKANWAFRLTENANRRLYVRAARKAMWTLVVAPLLLSGLVIFSQAWGWRTALLHALFCGLTNAVLVELFLLRFPKIPFTCSYLPGKANLPFMGALYGAGFLTYVTGLSPMGLALMRKPSGFAVFTVVVAGLITWLVWRRQENVDVEEHMKFDDEPEVVVTRLNIV